ncbi:hypothetical protein I3843_08G166200 [Carya illinoinensis]|nr:hypothetical protein I3843_08G166200 [Carya illinoinensis]
MALEFFKQDPVSIYYSKLKTLWDELAVYDPMPACTCGQLTVLSDRYQRDSVIQFLMGLNDKYSNVRDQIMLLEPIPTVSKAFSLKQQQKQQHQIISAFPNLESMALVTNTYLKNNAKSHVPSCSHCKQTGHVAERCYKLHGYPPGHKFHKRKNFRSSVNQVSMSLESNQEETNENLVSFTKA